MAPPRFHGAGVRGDLGAAAGPAEREGALIYLSLESLGSADVELMQRLVDVLATTQHRVIVSKGPLADQITLHDNQTGEGFLPQPAILPMVDLVITHGGNNTVTEAFHHGKPMIVLPLFWDQVDNAQRVHETGFGRKGFHVRFQRQELTERDRPVAEGSTVVRASHGLSSRIKSTSGTVRGADLIERVGLGRGERGIVENGSPAADMTSLATQRPCKEPAEGCREPP